MAISIKNVTKSFGDTKALNNISMDINDGEFIAILGPSGCGKTTLLRTVAGFVRPDSGSITANEMVFDSPERHLAIEKRNLGMVFQSFALWPHMTVFDNVEFPLKSRRNSHIDVRLRINMVWETLSSVGLVHLADRLPGELSGGQRQRVALARAIVEKPDILLMDEPLSALDAELKINMRKEIQDIHRLTGATILYVTHDQSEALAMADRIIIMKDGKIEQVGTPQEIYNEPKTLFVATFVSKCNLVRGTWRDSTFYVDGKPFIRGKVPEFFMKEGIYPIRPEEFAIIPGKEDGISGIIENRQFNGREIHYKVKCSGRLYTIYDNSLQSFNEGDIVTLKYKERYNAAAI